MCSDTCGQSVRDCRCAGTSPASRWVILTATTTLDGSGTRGWWPRSPPLDEGMLTRSRTAILHLKGWPGTEIGWGLIKNAWGKGYAAEGAAAAIDWAFTNLGWTEVIHVIDPRNTPSITLAERLDSIGQGPCKLPAPFENLSVEAWGQTRRQWLARRDR